MYYKVCLNIETIFKFEIVSIKKRIVLKSLN